MTTTAITAAPFPYSQAFQPARAAARTTRRTGYGRNSFVRFFEHHPVRYRYIAELVSEGRPRRVIDAFRHLGFGKLRGRFIAGDVGDINMAMPPFGGAPVLSA